MGADAAWTVTGFVLRVSSWFYLDCVENNWGIACWKLRWFPAVVLTENNEGGEYDIMILAAVQADLLSTTQHRQNSGRFELLEFIPWVFSRLNLQKLRSGFNLNVPQQLVSVVTANRHFFMLPHLSYGIRT